jgi:hypothetical protein
MNKAIGIGAGIGAFIIVAIIAYQVNENMFPTQYQENFRILGPLTIDKDKYVLGENVYGFMSLHPLEAGAVSFYIPNGDLYYSVGFNGSSYPDQKFYFRPMLEHIRNICTAEEIVGTWTVTITGKTLTDDRLNLTIEPKTMKFEFVNKILPGLEDKWSGNVCTEKPKESQLEIYNPGSAP